MLSSRERYLAIMNFEKPDRLMRWEFGYFSATLGRWYAEGLPKEYGIPSNIQPGEALAGPAGYWGWGPIWTPQDYDVKKHFHFDHGLVNIPVENWIFPKFEQEIIEDMGDSIISRDGNGITVQKMKDGSTTTWLAWPVANREDWERLKSERFNVQSSGRMPENWNGLIVEYANRDYPLSIGGAMVSYFGSLRDLMGITNHLIAYYDQPNLIHDILGFLTDFWIELYDPILEKVKPDCLEIWEDMAYKNGPLISPQMVREFMLPYYKKLIGFFQDHGVKNIVVDTDGDCIKLIPLFMEAGVTAMYPWEVQAGMDIVEIRKAYPTLRMLGGLDKRALARGKNAIDKELEYKVPFMLEQGGYIPYADHLIPPDVSWKDFVYYREKLDTLSNSVYGHLSGI